MEGTERKLHEIFRCTLTLLNHNSERLGPTRSIDPLRAALTAAMDELDERRAARKAAAEAKASLAEKIHGKPSMY